MSLKFLSSNAIYNVKLFKGADHIPYYTLGEPFDGFKDFADCKSSIADSMRKSNPDLKEKTIQERTDKVCGAKQAKVETKLAEMKQKKRLVESVDWTTWVTPTPEDNLIESEVLHVTVSGNRIDYTKEELLPAVNTLIGQPLYWVPLDKVTLPDMLHKDPAKAQVGEIKLARFEGNTIHVLSEVTPEIKQMVQDGLITQGSIEASFVVASESDKVIADQKPEFITFTGYLLLPNEGTETPAGPTGPPGDSGTSNQVFEQLKDCLGCCCVKGMSKGKPEATLFF